MAPPAKLSREEIKRIIVSTLKPLGVTKICLFGSFARNESTEASDIDILVSLPELKNRRHIGLQWFDLDQRLEQLLGRPVDLVTDNSLRPSFRSIVEKDLEIIYEQAG